MQSHLVLSLMAVVFIVSLAVASNSSGDKPVPDILKIVECQWVPTGGSHSSNLGGGGGSLFVTQVMEIDAPINANFNWQIQTDKDHVLVFTVVGKGGNFEQVQEFLSIHDGLKVDSSVLLFENQTLNKVSNNTLPQAIYTTGSTAQVRFKKTPILALKLKIQKAVKCPVNLGAESQCGRVVDEISCYCLTSTKRNQTSQTSYCKSNGMGLVAIESNSEQEAIRSVWGTSTEYWTSGSDEITEGRWIWQSTGLNMLPGYTNWSNPNPNNGWGEIENCLEMNSPGNWNKEGKVGWNDDKCSKPFGAICEAHPVSRQKLVSVIKGKSSGQKNRNIQKNFKSYDAVLSTCTGDLKTMKAELAKSNLVVDSVKKELKEAKANFVGSQSVIDSLKWELASQKTQCQNKISGTAKRVAMPSATGSRSLNLGSCGKTLFVADAVVIDALSGNCKRIETDKNHVLVFTIVQGGNFEHVQEFLSIHDALKVESSVLLFENQMHNKVSNKTLPQAVYTTGSIAEVRFKNTPTSVLKLKIQKAVKCPANLDAKSQCGRIVDEISCYCRTSIKRNQADQSSYCKSKGMKLVAIESDSEQKAIRSVWGTSTEYWTSGTDKKTQGRWVWESTGLDVEASYWGNGQPDNAGRNEHCLELNSAGGWNRRGRVGWNDDECRKLYSAICEAHP